MSKTQLKKELLRLDRDQLQELIIALYDARKEAREYLDFFINPDVDKMMEKYKAAAAKEIGRVTRHRAKPRMSRLRKLVKDFASFDVGSELEAELRVDMIERLCRTGSECWIAEVTQVSAARFISETLSMVDAAGLLSVYLPRVVAAVEKMPRSPWYVRELRDKMSEALEDFKSTL